jgi:hypothetical protein
LRKHLWHKVIKAASFNSSLRHSTFLWFLTSWSNRVRSSEKSSSMLRQSDTIKTKIFFIDNRIIFSHSSRFWNIFNSFVFTVFCESFKSLEHYWGQGRTNSIIVTTEDRSSLWRCKASDFMTGIEDYMCVCQPFTHTRARNTLYIHPM